MGVGCGPAPASDEPNFGGRGRVVNTRGSAVVVTHDDRVAVVANRTDGVVTVHPLSPDGDPEQLVGEGVEIPVHPLSESKPWAAVIGADDDTAYVLLRGLGQVMRVRGLHSVSPVESGRVSVGSDPTSIAISPRGEKIYVANFGEGTISVILTKIFDEGPLSHAKWDLNLRLAKTRLLGPLLESDAPAGPWSEAELQRHRPALAHPRALALTDDGDKDDDDEILYATEFFAQPVSDPTVVDPDRNRQGLVYPILVGVGAGNAPRDELTGEAIDTISLSPTDTGAADARDQQTACIPNQLYSMATDGNRVLVTSVCASPAGPVESGTKGQPFASNNFKTIVHSAVFAIDRAAQREIPEQSFVFTPALGPLYEADATPAGDRRMPLIPSDIVVRGAPGTARRAYVNALGSGALFSVAYDGNGLPGEVGTSGSRFMNIGDASLPVGIGLLRTRPLALVLSDRKPDLSVLDLVAERRVVTRPTVVTDYATDPATDPSELVSYEVREGRRLFATGLGAWSLGGQGHSSCESCHPDGLSDGLVWRFARGPRRTLSTASTYHKSDATRRVLLWTANIDEIHDIEAIARGFSGGVGGVIWNPYASVPEASCRLLFDGASLGTDIGTACATQKQTTYRHNGLNGSLVSVTAQERGEVCEPGPAPCDINASTDWNVIDAFIRSLKAPKAPERCIGSDMGCLDPASVNAGRTLFVDARCAACHGGPHFTLSRVFYEPGVESNGMVPYLRPEVLPDRRAMLGRLRATTYQAPNELFRSLNRPLVATGSATGRPAPPADATDVAFLDYFYPPAGTAAPLDQINCVLRSVGTFPEQVAGEDPNYVGIAPSGVTAAVEERLTLAPEPPLAGQPDTYVPKLAIGETGFNIPSLVGLATGAPYFHAGNARTLEELFDPVFSAHHAAIVSGFQPNAQEVNDLVSFLLSIDEGDSIEPVPVPTPLTGELEVDPDLCAPMAQPN